MGRGAFLNIKNNNKKTPTTKKTKFGKVSEVLQWKECILCKCLAVLAYFSSQFYAKAISALQISLPKYMRWDKWGGKASFYGVLRHQERLKPRSENLFVWLNILLEIGFRDLAALAQRSAVRLDSPESIGPEEESGSFLVFPVFAKHLCFGHPSTSCNSFKSSPPWNLWNLLSKQSGGVYTSNCS